MANLIVSFTTAFPYGGHAVNVPLEVGNSVRTEQLLIEASASYGNPMSAAAVEGELVVSLRAGADCWFKIDEDPVVSVGDAAARFLASGERMQLWIKTGEKVGVIAA